MGDLLALLALAVVVLAGWVTWRRPFVGLGVLVAGMAFHNFLIMVLVRLGTFSVLIRAVQAWKEAILVLLVVVAGLRVYRAYRAGTLRRPIVLDWLAAGFLLVMVFYLVLPAGVLHGHAGLQQRFAAFRIVALLPVLYGLGRTFKQPAEDDQAAAVWLIVGAAAVVGAFGLVELWFVPTRTWLDWGVNQFSAFLGFTYSGPRGLPENFFQTAGPELYLRRMVSTYLSPLGIAYTGLLAFPIGVVLLDSQRKRSRGQTLAIIATTFLLAGMLFSVTRVALFALIGEAILLALIIRRPWLYVSAPLLVAAVLAFTIIYPQVGPAVDINLDPISLRNATFISAGDPSLLEHLKTVAADAKVAIRHPLGEGLGSSGSSANRFSSASTASPDYAPGESAILTVFVDTGVLGGALYLALYLLGLYRSALGLLAARRGSLDWALPMAAVVGGLALIPITLTSDVWGDLSVTFLFWWAVGYAASLTAGRQRASIRELVGFRTRVGSF